MTTIHEAVEVGDAALVERLLAMDPRAATLLDWLGSYAT